MSRFQLVFRQDGENDRSGYRYNDQAGEPHINGKLLVDGEVYVIRGIERLLRRDEAGDSISRFVCTLVVEPARA